MAEPPAAGPRRSYQTLLLVVAVTAAGFNLRTAVSNLPPLFPDPWACSPPGCCCAA